MQEYIRALALWGISKGLSIPSAPLERIDELKRLRALLTELKVDCVLDVGANVGQYARDLRGIGYNGLIVSFEPQSREFTRLRARFADDPNWRGHHLALGDKPGTLPINVDVRRPVRSSFLKSTEARATTTEIATVARLDDLLPDLQSALGFERVFLKMDTQGYDARVFAGASGCLDRIVGIQSELSIIPLYEGMPNYMEALRTYEAAGFGVYNLSVENRERGALLELNCFMRRLRGAIAIG